MIRPCLAGGGTVLCDRYADSTLAYQGYGRGLSLDHVRAINHVATAGLTPDLTFLLDVPPEVGLARKDSAGGGSDRIGQEDIDFHRRVRDGFLSLARKEPQRFFVVDATRPANEVSGRCWERLRKLLDRL